MRGVLIVRLLACVALVGLSLAGCGDREISTPRDAAAYIERHAGHVDAVTCRRQGGWRCVARVAGRTQLCSVADREVKIGTLFCQSRVLASTRCNELALSEHAPRARLPRTLIFEGDEQRLRLHLRATQHAQATMRLSVHGRRIETRTDGDYTCIKNGSQAIHSSRLSAYGRRVLRREPRALVHLTLKLVNGFAASRTMTANLRVRARERSATTR